MNTDEIYLYLSSKDSINYFPHNSASEFRVNLPKCLNLDESWSVALTEIICTGSATYLSELNVYSNIIKHRIVGCKELQLLARIDAISDKRLVRQIDNPIYLPVSLEDLTQVKIQLVNDKGVGPAEGHVIVILHLKQNLSTMDHETIVLRSDDCKDIFPSNSPSNFKVRLPRELTFPPNEYEVGLMNLSLTNSPILKTAAAVLKFEQPELKPTVEDLFFVFTYDEAKGLEEFVSALNKASASYSPSVGRVRKPAKYKFASNELRIDQQGVYLNPENGQNINFELIFDTEVGEFIKRMKVGKKKSSNSGNIYLHCSIVQPSIVGDELAPVLRVLNLSPFEHGKRILFDFEKPYYLPLGDSIIRDIEVALKFDSDAYANLKEGNVVLTLDIRKRTILDN